MKNSYIVVLILMLFLISCSNDKQIKEPIDTVEEAAEIINEPLLWSNQIINIAHRGASAYAPEHTFPSYKMGEEMGANYIEIDLQMTKDNELIAMHDIDVSRTTNGEGLIKDYTLEEIKTLDAGSWYNDKYPELAQSEFINLMTPTLDEIISYFGLNSNYYIETKSPEAYPNMIKELILILEKHKLIGPDASKGKVIIQSFSKESLIGVNKIDPRIPLIQLIKNIDDMNFTKHDMKEIKEYATGIGVNHKQLKKDQIETVHAAELLIHPYIVNETVDMERLIEWGVNGMFTDYPDRLNGVLEQIDK